MAGHGIDKHLSFGDFLRLPVASGLSQSPRSSPGGCPANVQPAVQGTTVEWVACERTTQPEGNMAEQVKADMSDIVDIHHRQHHKEWLTVVDTVTYPGGTRLVCECSCPATVYVDTERVIKTRER